MTLKILLKILRKIYKLSNIDNNGWIDESKIDYFNQEANDYIREKIISADSGLMICKFGAVEINAVTCNLLNERGLKFKDYLDYVANKKSIFPEEALNTLCNNAGFFPENEDLKKKYVDLFLSDITDVDILASYVNLERYVDDRMPNVRRVNLDGFCAPFLWKNPWSSALKDKKVLVVHPFVDSIQKQYEHNREKLFDDKSVLPQFKSISYVKAIQSNAGNADSVEFEDWFSALHHMEKEIDKYEYDVAIIGCGAYGMHLAAYVKRKKKIAIHLAGWTQMLFGVYGNRWVNDQPEFKQYINEYWIRPSESEKPRNLEKVENGCYW